MGKLSRFLIVLFLLSILGIMQPGLSTATGAAPARVVIFEGFYSLD